MVEEFARFIMNDYALTSKIKNIRHGLQKIIDCLPIEKRKLLKKRDSCSDVGRNIVGLETQRDCPADILFANLNRIKESVRVLEEFSKLINKKAALSFKKIRYCVYEAEKTIATRVKYK